MYILVDVKLQVECLVTLDFDICPRTAKYIFALQILNFDLTYFRNNGGKIKLILQDWSISYS